MNKTEMLQALEAAVPSLQGKLHIERVLYKKAANKAYMSFLCDELVRENDFLQVERTLKELFPQVNVALRIASPGLGEDFLGDLDKYKSVLTDFLRRQSPAQRRQLSSFARTTKTIRSSGHPQPSRAHGSHCRAGRPRARLPLRQSESNRDRLRP